MNASQFRAEPVPPIAPSNYKAPQRREIVDPDNFDPDFQPARPPTGSSAAAPAARLRPFQLRRPYAPRDRGSGQHRPGFPTRAPARNGSSHGGSPRLLRRRRTSSPRRKEIVDPDNIDPDFSVTCSTVATRGRVAGRVRWMLVVA